ncbi:MAG: glycosyltransferase family 2 protein [Bacteroidales bacterium]|nr:glycosyltransferase family 2 protein [Bacteroidales bacterium]
MNDYSPIALFVFNRPNHTQKTIDTLILNPEVSTSDLFIFCDGPKKNSNDEELGNISEVKKIIESDCVQKHFSKVTIKHQDKNIGLANSIKYGVSFVLNEYNTIIVLEDDLVLSSNFINYMNHALFKFCDSDKIMHVGGYTPPVKIPIKDDFYFLRFASSWGWATWKRAWEKYENSGEKLLNMLIQNNQTKKFDFNGAYPFTQMLKDNISNKINSWAINWNATIFLNDGLGVYPKKSLVNNIGFDGTGVHCNTSKVHNIRRIKTTTTISFNNKEIVENKKAKNAYEKFYKKISRTTFLMKVVDKLKLMYRNAKN